VDVLRNYYFIMK